jgi:hypothetical protein
MSVVRLAEPISQPLESIGHMRTGAGVNSSIVIICNHSRYAHVQGVPSSGVIFIEMVLEISELFMLVSQLEGG